MSLMNSKKFALAALVVIVGSGAAYAVSPYFTESEINEPLPPFATTATNPGIDSVTPDSSPSDTNHDIDPASNDDKNDPSFMDSSARQANDNMVEDRTGDADSNDDGVDAVADVVSNIESSFARTVSYAGVFVGVGDGIHDAGGRAYTIPLEDGSSVLRLEDFYSTNGPGLRVYLATDTKATDHISLGDLKANRGNQNYEIPSGTNLEKYDHVLIWCEPFRVLFGSAELDVR